MPAPTRDPAFRALLAARCISWAGSAVTLVALPVLLYQRTGSAALSGLLAALETVPYLLFGLVAGALADRWEPRRVLVTGSLASAAVMGSVPLADAFGVLSTVQLLVVALGVATVFVVTDASGFALVPALVGRDGVGPATGLMASANTLIMLVGPAVAGVAATAVGAAAVIGVDAVSYLVAAALLLRLPAFPPAPAPRLTAARLRADVGTGVAYLRDHRLVRTLTLAGFGNSVTAGAVTGLVVVLAVRRFGFAADDARTGLLFTASAVGSLLASLLMTRLHRRFPVGRIALAGLAAGAVACAGLGSLTWWVAGALTLAAFQFAATTVAVNGIVVRQTVTPGPLQARVNTTARMIAWGGTPLGAAGAGWLADQCGPGTALVVAAVGAGLAALTAGRALRDAPRLAAVATPA